jgi:hypothetical protein
MPHLSSSTIFFGIPCGHFGSQPIRLLFRGRFG